jgi:hypothetical protein
MEGELQSCVAETEGFALRPRACFVAWSGVLTLVFSGWPPAVTRLKSQLAQHHSESLPPENSGSRFPKVTLAALARGRQALSLEELNGLLEVCAALEPALAALPLLPVRALSTTLWKRASHEELLACHDIQLRPISQAPPTAEEAGYVQAVLDEAVDSRAYLASARRPGDIDRYRTAQPRAGASLVAFVHPRAVKSSAQAEPHEQLGRVLGEFQRRVEALLPGAYAWIQPRAMHCTVRALA